jgi:hypothetical protein
VALAANISWPDEVDEVIGGDQAVVLAYVTPARGVVLTPLTNFGLRDRDAGTMTPLNSSVGMWKKLRRLAENPRIAVVYHTRDQGFSERPEYVLVQGRAALSSLEDHTWLERHRESWERFAGPRTVGPLWERWLRVYHRRVGIEIAVERLLVWPGLDCHGRFEAYGAALPEGPPAPQRLPAEGTGPRVRHARAARRVARLPNRLLGWVGADGFPVVMPVNVCGAEERGMVLAAPPGSVPSGGRRAGLVGHSFARFTYGQHQRKYTGWLETDGGRLVYAPHTETGYYLPWSRFAYRLGAGLVTRRGYRQAKRAGFVST